MKKEADGDGMKDPVAQTPSFSSNVAAHPRRSSREPRGSMYSLGFWVIVILVQVLGKYMIIGYLDP